MSGLFGLLGKKKKTEAADAEAVGTAKEHVSVEADVSPVEGADASVTGEKVKVTYLENPLPLPKKHEKRSMEFEVQGKIDDFDVRIDENDDFDV